MTSLPHRDWLPAITEHVAAPAGTRALALQDRAGEADLSAVVSHALRRGVTAKFFATVGAEGNLRADLKAVCREARRQNIQVEHLIVAFKDAWRALPEAKTYPQGTQGTEFLGHVITLCIAEFYATSRAD